MAAKAGVERTTLRTIAVDSTNQPPRLDALACDDLELSDPMTSMAKFARLRNKE